MRQPCRLKPGRLTALRLLMFLPAVCAAVLVSCAREPQRPPSIVLVDPSVIEIRDLPAAPAPGVDLSAMVRVHVGERATGDPPVAGRVEADGRTLRFRPALPLETGRAYFVRGPSVEAVVRVPAQPLGPPVRVTAVHPVLDGVPENVLRLYIHFSGPMSRETGTGHVQLLDETGAAVVDPFLPVEAEFWSGDHRRYTLFFDPGRVKTGILPNTQMGRPLQRGKRYTLVVSRRWTDASGRPLADDFRQPFTPGFAIVEPLDPGAWPIAAPDAGTRDPFIVRFPHALDHGLLQRALAIEAGGQPVEGTFDVPPGAREWRFTPTQPWTASPHHLVVLSILEDPSGNRIGRAFETEGATRGPAGPERVLIPWSPVR